MSENENENKNEDKKKDEDLLDVEIDYSNIDPSLLLTFLTPELREKIQNPSKLEPHASRELNSVIRNLMDRRIGDEQIVVILSQFPIGKGRDLAADVKRLRDGEMGDDEIARVFAEKNQNNLKYCRDYGKWYFWSGWHWQPDRKGEATERVRFVMRELPISSLRRRAGTVFGVERLARSDKRLAIQSDDLDKDPWLLTTPGGTVDLQTGRLGPPQPMDMITKITKVSPGGKCELWLNFLKQVTNNDQGYIDYLQRALGYSLTGFTTEEALFFLHGPGGNGKSLTLNTFAAILGDYAGAAPMAMLAESKSERHPQEIAGLVGKRFVIAQEAEEGRAWDEVKVKSLTSQDLVTAHFMHENDFTFLPTHKLWISANNAPALKTVDDAMKRRFNRLPFVFKPDPDKIDKRLAMKLIAEYPGILQWAIEGCLEWQRQGLNPPKVVVEATQDYIEYQDSFQQWISECCEVDKEFKDTNNRLIASWFQWASLNHQKQGTDKMFKEKMEKAGFVYKKNALPVVEGNKIVKYEKNNLIKYHRGFIGIKLRKQIVVEKDSKADLLKRNSREVERPTNG